MRKKATRKRPYFTMESAMTAILRNASGKMHHGILFAPPLVKYINSVCYLKMFGCYDDINNNNTFLTLKTTKT